MIVLTGMLRSTKRSVAVGWHVLQHPHSVRCLTIIL